MTKKSSTANQRHAWITPSDFGRSDFGPHRGMFPYAKRWNREPMLPSKEVNRTESHRRNRPPRQNALAICSPFEVDRRHRQLQLHVALRPSLCRRNRRLHFTIDTPAGIVKRFVAEIKSAGSRQRFFSAIRGDNGYFFADFSPARNKCGLPFVAIRKVVGHVHLDRAAERSLY